MRNTARAQLAAEIPPAMLGELIGVGATTASRWASIANGNWLAYVDTPPASSARRQKTTPRRQAGR